MRVEEEKVVKGQIVICDECREEIFWSDVCDPIHTNRDIIEYSSRSDSLYMGRMAAFICEKDLCPTCKAKRIEKVREAIKSALLPLGFSPLGFEEKEK